MSAAIAWLRYVVRETEHSLAREYYERENVYDGVLRLAVAVVHSHLKFQAPYST